MNICENLIFFHLCGSEYPIFESWIVIALLWDMHIRIQSGTCLMLCIVIYLQVVSCVLQFCERFWVCEPLNSSQFIYCNATQSSITPVKSSVLCWRSKVNVWISILFTSCSCSSLAISNSDAVSKLHHSHLFMHKIFSEVAPEYMS